MVVGSSTVCCGVCVPRRRRPEDRDRARPEQSADATFDGKSSTVFRPPIFTSQARFGIELAVAGSIDREMIDRVDAVAIDDVGERLLVGHIDGDERPSLAHERRTAACDGRRRSRGRPRAAPQGRREIGADLADGAGDENAPAHGRSPCGSRSCRRHAGWVVDLDRIGQRVPDIGFEPLADTRPA